MRIVRYETQDGKKAKIWMAAGRQGWRDRWECLWALPPQGSGNASRGREAACPFRAEQNRMRGTQLRGTCQGTGQ